MTQQTIQAQTGGETGESEELIKTGAVTFGLEYRTCTKAPKRTFVSVSTDTNWKSLTRNLCVSTAFALRLTTATGTLL